MSEKRFDPTRKRLRDARRKGKNNKSQLLTSAAASVTLLATFALIARGSWVNNRMLLEYIWLEGCHDVSGALFIAGHIITKSVLPFLTMAGAVSIAMHVLQGGSVFEPVVVAPRFDRCNPVAGFSRIIQGLRGLPWMLIRVLTLVVIIAVLLQSAFPKILETLTATDELQVPIFLSSITRFILVLSAALIVIGVIDLCISRSRFWREVAMTFEERKREQREDEGDPFIKAHRRAQH